ncbi:hypothetical protein GPN2_10059 [Streptomyces murinus]
MSGDVVHRLGTAVVVAVALGWGGRLVVSVRRGRRARQRAAVLLGSKPGPQKPPSAVMEAVRRWLPPVGAAGGVWVLVGGAVGALLGLGVGAVLWRRRVGRAAGGAVAVDTAEAARQLPLAADLLAACIAAGAGPVVAAQAVGRPWADPSDRRWRGARRRYGSAAPRRTRGTGWPRCRARVPWRGCWSGPTSRDCPPPLRWPASPRTPARNGAAPRRHGPGGRPY